MAAATYEDYVAICELARPVSDGALAKLASQGISRTRSDLSERVAGLLVREYRTGRRADEIAGSVTCLAEEVASKFAGPQPLGPEQFATEFSEAFDHRWQTCGAASLVQFPPSALGLGSSRRPPLIEPAAQDGIALGTDRSVYGRYRLHYDSRAETRSSALTGVDAPDRPRPRQPRERALEETRRACMPAGLCAREHLGVLVAVTYGADLIDRQAKTSTPGDTRGAWVRLRNDTKPLTPLAAAQLTGADPDPGIVDAVRDRAEIWLASDEARRLELTRGDLRSQVDVIGCALARKIWMDLHRREREFQTPCSRVHLAHYLRYGFTKTVPEALTSWGAGISGAGAELTSQTVLNSSEARSFVERRTLTIELLVGAELAGHEQQERLVQWKVALDAHRHDQIRQQYGAWAAASAADAGADTDQLLTADEFVDLLTDFLTWGDD